MNAETVNLTSLICDSINSIFFRIFSSIDNTVYSNLDNILFINTDIINNLKFEQLFGTDSTNGILLIANSLILGIVLFYVLKFATAHLIYYSIDSPYQFAFKCIIFIACMNSSLWICEQIINLNSLISSSICEIGNSITGQNITFSNLISNINSEIYLPVETFDIFSVSGIIKLVSCIGVIWILITYSIRFIMCKILILLSPFAFVSLITNHLDGFFKGWLKQFLINLSLQILVSLILCVGFSLEFSSNNVLSQIIYLAIILSIAKCNYNLKELFNYIYEYSNNTLKKFI